MTLPVPEGPAQITEGWLSRALGRPVVPAHLSRIGADQSFTGGRLYRIEFDGGSLVAKLAPAAGPMRAAMARANAREVAFYRGAGSGLPVPDCLHAASDAASGASILLLQDLRSRTAARFVDGWTPVQARAVVRALARVHACWWDRADTAALPGGALSAEFDFPAAWKAYPAALAALDASPGLPKPVRALGDFIAADPARALAAPDHGPRTLLHRDCHADNVMFGADGAAVLLDWQMAGTGPGAWDLSYALVSSLPVPRRRSAEKALVAAYLDDLQAFGATDYGWEACWADYLRAAAAKLFLTVVATATFDNAGPAKADWRRADLARLLAFCADHAVGPALYGADQRTA